MHANAITSCNWDHGVFLKPPGSVGQQDLLGQEMHKLHTELENFIQQVEKLSIRDISCVENEHNVVEDLEPSEQKKLEVRWQKQSERSSRIIYALHQQVLQFGYS